MCCVFWYLNGWGENPDLWDLWCIKGSSHYTKCPQCTAYCLEGKFKGKNPEGCNCYGKYVRWLGDPINGEQLRNDTVIIRN